MDKKYRKPNGYWNNYEHCYNEAQKYKTRNEFQKGCNGAYQVARKNKWLDDYDWFEPSATCLKWDYEHCYNEAQKYKTKNEFRKGCNGAYQVAINNKWLDDYTWFVNGKIKWTKEKCHEEAQKYHSRSKFMHYNKSAYESARKNKWLDDYTWIKDIRFDIYTDKVDSVYVYEFKEQKTAYIGRTLIRCQNKRDRDHIFSMDSVSSFAKKHKIAVPPMKILETNLTIKEGAKREGYWLKKYQEDGWVTLNQIKTGGIGRIGKGKWNYKSCFEEAKKYKTRSEFEKCNQSAYESARKNKWLDDYVWFEKGIIIKALKQTKWNKETCFEEAQKYKTRTEFSKNCSGAYHVAIKNKWLDDFFPF